MRVLLPEKFQGLNLTDNEKLFIELWYRMTHIQSLDSCRVKCMNSRTIIREIKEQIEFHDSLECKDQKPSNNEILRLLDEALSILSDDCIIKDFYPKLIQSIPREDNNKFTLENKHRYIIRDFYTILEPTYFNNSCIELRKKIQSGSEDDIKNVLNAFLSDLLDRGWPYEALFYSHNHFLQQNQYTFSEKFDFLIELLQKPPIEFEAIIKVSGSEKIQNLGLL